MIIKLIIFEFNSAMISESFFLGSDAGVKTSVLTSKSSITSVSETSVSFSSELSVSESSVLEPFVSEILSEPSEPSGSEPSGSEGSEGSGSDSSEPSGLIPYIISVEKTDTKGNTFTYQFTQGAFTITIIVRIPIKGRYEFSYVDLIYENSDINYKKEYQLRPTDIKEVGVIATYFMRDMAETDPQINPRNPLNVKDYTNENRMCDIFLAISRSWSMKTLMFMKIDTLVRIEPDNLQRCHHHIKMAFYSGKPYKCTCDPNEIIEEYICTQHTDPEKHPKVCFFDCVRCKRKYKIDNNLYEEYNYMRYGAVDGLRDNYRKLFFGRLTRLNIIRKNKKKVPDGELPPIPESDFYEYIDHNYQLMGHGGGTSLFKNITDFRAYNDSMLNTEHTYLSN